MYAVQIMLEKDISNCVKAGFNKLNFFGDGLVNRDIIKISLIGHIKQHKDIKIKAVCSTMLRNLNDSGYQTEEFTLKRFETCLYSGLDEILLKTDITEDHVSD